MTIRIVPIAEEHIEGFHQCLDTVARERKYLLFVQAPPTSSVRSFVLSNIMAQNAQLVALDSGRVVGWCDVLPRQAEGFRHCGVLGIGVLPGYRSQGIGKRLLEETLAKAAQRALERVELDVYASNRPAISLYEKFGFEVEGVKKRARKIDGVYDDVVMMARAL